jgi:RNA 2',3'-cyclic 3'-phosphodiesterase
MREAMVSATRKAAQASGGRPVPAANLHVTLAFLGSVPERRLGELAEIATGATTGGSLELAFDHFEYWRGAQLLCALPAATPAAIAALTRRLQDVLAASGFAPDLKSSRLVGAGTTGQFRPHVTLARKVHQPLGVTAMQPVTWGLTDFVLVDSRTHPRGSVYTVLKRFSLAARSRPGAK